MNSEILQKLEVMGHLLIIQHNQIKHQLEIVARLAEFEQNSERTPTCQSILNNRRQSFRNEQDLDERIVRNIKINAPSFDGTLEPQLFLDRMKEMDCYFKWYIISEVRKSVLLS